MPRTDGPCRWKAMESAVPLKELDASLLREFRDVSPESP